MLACVGNDASILRERMDTRLWASCALIQVSQQLLLQHLQTLSWFADDAMASFALGHQEGLIWWVRIKDALDVFVIDAKYQRRKRINIAVTQEIWPNVSITNARLGGGIRRFHRRKCRPRYLSPVPTARKACSQVPSGSGLPCCNVCVNADEIKFFLERRIILSG